MTGFAQLLCGWAVVNLESSGTGVGVVARSGNWPATLGFTTRELGSLVTWDGTPASPDAFALEFMLVRGLAVAVLKTPSNDRPGTCVAHLIAGERGALDGAVALSLYDSGRFRTGIDDPGFPTDRWDLLPKPLEDNSFAFTAAADAYLDLDWLPPLLGYGLARLAGRGPAVELHVEHGSDALAMLRAIYGMLPRNSLRELTFRTSAAPGPDVAISAVTRDGPGPVAGERRIVTPGDRGNESDPFVQLGQQIVDLRRAGITLPENLTTADEIGHWCYRRQLRALAPVDLDDDRLAEVIADPEIGPEWFQDKTVATRAVRLALERPSVARALARIDHRPSVRRTFEEVLTDRVMHDTRDPGHTLDVARQLGFDLSEVVVKAARRRLDTGHGLSTADAAAVWPRLHEEWATGNHKRRQAIAGYLTQHRALREPAALSRDRALAHKAIRAEVDDPAVPTGSSHVLRTAMQTNLTVVAQVAVDVACDGRDRYALEQILSCAPPDRLPALVAECARYPALPATDLMKALTLTRSDPADLVEALRPAWHHLRRTLGLPEQIEALVVLSAAEPPAENGQRGGIRLPHLGFGRRNGKDQIPADLSPLLHSPDDPQALQRILATTPPDQLQALVGACARQWDLSPTTLMHALAALDLPPADLREALTEAWPWLRTRLDLPQVIAPLLTLLPADGSPQSWHSVAREQDSRRGWQFWR
ncbi:hypothetical protein [Nocardia concava]|uniref:hypothetical protein n=1 Tax=Nocardia concava TaxID=257281 RepID=UPI0002DC3758|nr:hypothetical protein [Nocardia concava]